MLKLLLLIPLLLGLNACTAERSYYVLSPAGRPPSGGGKGIGVGPVTIADYLVERPYVVFQSSPNKLEISDLHQWGGDLRNDFTRVLTSDLGLHNGSANAVSYPWDREGALDYQVTVDVRQFHGTSDGDAVLEASWKVYQLPTSRLVASKTSTIREPLLGDGFEALVAAQSRLIDRLAVVISAQLK